MGRHFEDEIAALAHRYYEKEGRPEGRAHEHWLRAEEELRSQRSSSEAEAAAEEAMRHSQ